MRLHRPVRLLALAACPVLSFASFTGVAADSGEADVAVWDAGLGWLTPPAAPTEAPERAWEIEVADGDIAVALGTIVVATTSSAETSVERLDPTSGAPLWSTVIGDGDEPAVELDPSGQVAVVTVRDAHANESSTVIDAADGNELWTADVRIPTPRLVGDLVLIAAAGETRAVDRDSGETRWIDPRSLHVSAGAIAAFDFDRHEVDLLDPATGDVRWSTPFDIAPQVLVVDDTALIVEPHGGEAAVEGSTVTAHEVTGGAELWSGEFSFVAASPIEIAAAPSGDTGALLVASSANMLVGIDLTTGETRWTLDVEDGGFATFVRAGSHTFAVADLDGHESLVDGNDGRVVHDLGQLHGTVNGSTLYAWGGAEVRSLALPGLEPHWTTSADAPGYVAPVDGGFVRLNSGDDESIVSYQAPG